MMKHVMVLLVLVAACGKAETRRGGSKMSIDLDWRMKVDGDRLRVDYTVTNHTDKRVYVLDQLMVGNQVDPDAIIVMNGDGAGKVTLVRALVKTNEKVLAMPLPVARPVEAEGSVTGTAFAPLPLRAWHNYSMVDALQGTATSATLQIGYVADTGPGTVKELDLGGTKVMVPAAVGGQLLLEGASQPIP